MSIYDKVQIGSTVKVNLELSKERLTKETIEAINTSSECTISDYKITDGRGIGLILKLSNGKEEWFFEDEIEFLDSNGNIINQEVKIKNNLFFDFVKNLKYQQKIQINRLINPMNFMTWLIVSLKDIF